MTWKTLGAVSPAQLQDARLQLHHAAQIVASAGITFLAPEPDDSHPNLAWVDPLGAMMGRPLTEAAVQVGLHLFDFSLHVVDRDGLQAEALPLDGRTLDDCYTWLASALARVGVEPPATGITRSPYEIPSHAVGGGAAFSRASPEAFAELARWFTNAQHALSALTSRTVGASELRCWPHHFDLGALVTIATDSRGSLSRSVGIGLSPGDESYAEPYFYVSPWPYPEPDALPALDRGGFWHTEGFTSAILPGSELLEGQTASQGERLHAFLESAFHVSQEALAT